MGEADFHVCTSQNMVKAFNLWMDDYLNDPTKFLELGDEVESYGKRATKLFLEYLEKVKSE